MYHYLKWKKIHDINIKYSFAHVAILFIKFTALPIQGSKKKSLNPMGKLKYRIIHNGNICIVNMRSRLFCNEKKGP